MQKLSDVHKIAYSIRDLESVMVIVEVLSSARATTVDAIAGLLGLVFGCVLSFAMRWAAVCIPVCSVIKISPWNVRDEKDQRAMFTLGAFLRATLGTAMDVRSAVHATVLILKKREGATKLGTEAPLKAVRGFWTSNRPLQGSKGARKTPGDLREMGALF